jgi:hypothetical protein
VISTDSGDGKFKRGKIDKEVAAILAQFAIFHVREQPIIVAGVLARRENVHHLLGSQRNRRTQDQTIDQRENCRVNANA